MTSNPLHIVITCDRIDWRLRGEFGHRIRQYFLDAVQQARRLKLPVRLDLSGVESISAGAFPLLLEAIEQLAPTGFHLSRCSNSTLRLLGIGGFQDLRGTSLADRAETPERTLFKRKFWRRHHIQVLSGVDGEVSGQLTDLGTGSMHMLVPHKILAGKKLELKIGSSPLVWHVKVYQAMQEGARWRIGATFMGSVTGRVLAEALGKTLLFDESSDSADQT